MARAAKPTGKRGSQVARIFGQIAQRTGKVMAEIGILGRAQVLAVPRSQPIGFRQQATKRLRPASDRRVQRQQGAALRTTRLVMSHGDAGGLIAQDQTCESTDAAAGGIVYGQAAQEIDQQVLAQILAVTGLQLQTPPQPAHIVEGNEFDQKYVAEQRQLIHQAFDAVRALRMVLENHPAASDHEVPDYLRNEKVWTMWSLVATESLSLPMEAASRSLVQTFALP